MLWEESVPGGVQTLRILLAPFWMDKGVSLEATCKVENVLASNTLRCAMVWIVPCTGYLLTLLWARV